MTKPKILIVDDDSKLSRLMHAILEKAGGYEVREENRSFAALSSAREFQPDLVLLDVDMPGKDGGDVRAELAGDCALSSVPVLFVTSLVARSEGSTTTMMRGGQRFLAKPVLPRALLEAVRGMLNGVAV